MKTTKIKAKRKSQEQRWQDWIDTFVNWQKENPNEVVNTRTVTKDGKHLGRWALSVMNTKNGSQTHRVLTDEKLQQLKDVGFPDTFVRRDTVEHLNLFVEAAKAISPTSINDFSRSDAYKSIYSWLLFVKYRASTRLAKPEIFKAINDAGLYEHVYASDEVWGNYCKELEQQLEIDGTIAVMSSHTSTKRRSLVLWLNKQIELAESNELQSKRLSKLEELLAKFG